MVDLGLLESLRKMGVKRAVIAGEGSAAHVCEVEFFPTISPIDLETLVPPPPGPPTEVDAAEPVKVPPAMARILKRGSVS